MSGPQDPAGARTYADQCVDVPRDFSATELTPEQEARRAELYAAAVEYAQAGWRLVPLWHVDENGQCACPEPRKYSGPEPWKCSGPGKHPRLDEWQKAATADPEWWRELAEGEVNPRNWYPLANIGLVQEAERTFSLDEDPDNGGDVTLQQLQERLGDDYEMPETLIRRTGSGGRHFEFAQPPGAPVPSMKLGPGLEIKGAVSYVLAPPSRTNKGPYSHILKNDPVPPPQWLLDLIGEKRKQHRGEPSRISPDVIPTGRIRAYRKSALESNAARLAKESKGDRNKTLNACAFALGQLAPGGITNEDECREVLYAAAEACGMDFTGDGVEGTFNSGWRSGLVEPFWPDWATEDDDPEFPMRTWDAFGLGARLVDRYAEILRWAPDAQRWMSWQSGQWEMDDKQAGEWMALPMIESLTKDEAWQYPETPDIQGEASPRQKFEAWVRTCRNPGAMTAAATVAKARPPMRIDLGKCDSNPLWINTRNGVYDAATASFREHDPGQLLTMRAAVSYDPGATCPRWDAFFEEVQPDPQMREYLYRIWGHSTTADTSEQSLFINHGRGANGKSVVMDVLSMTLGDYAQVVPIETLLTSRNKMGRVPNDVARMKGRRLLKCSETAEGRRIDEALIKALTGGEELVARFMRAEFFQFRPTGKIHLTSNYLGHMGDDDATWRRVHLIPWLVTIPEERRDKYLARRLYEEEASGIFNRLLAGLADWRARGGLCPPDTARKAVEEYRKNEDTLGQAVDELFTVDMDHVRCSAACSHLNSRSGECLFAEYERWAGKDRMGRTTFYDKLKERGYAKTKYQNKVMFSQLSVRYLGQ